MLKQSYFVTLAIVLIVAGCSSDGNERRQAYLDADYYKRLELPPDLTAPADKSQLNIPKPTDEATERFKRETANLGTGEEEAVVHVAMQVKGARMQTGDGVFWLEVDENADKLWPKLDAFWAHEGIKVVRNEPVLGMVETDWVSKLQLGDDAGFIEKIFNNIEPDKLDKFRMRVEPDNGKTKIFMSHSGIELYVAGDEVGWHSRCTDEGLEREILSRLALFVGLDEAQAKKVFENYHPYASRISVSTDNPNTLAIVGKMDFVWQRALRALDRLGADVKEVDSNAHQVKFAIMELSKENSAEEYDEIAESSELMQWLTGSGDDRQFMIKLRDNGKFVNLEILRPDGNPTESVLVEQFIKKLAIELQ